MAKSTYFGFNPPFLSSRGVMVPQADERLIKNDLLQLLLTIPGERAFRPTFGTDIRPTLFEPIDQFTFDTLKRSIINAVAQFEPRVDLIDVFLQASEGENLIDIKLFASLVIDPNVTFEVDLELPVGQSVSEIPGRVI